MNFTILLQKEIMMTNYPSNIMRRQFEVICTALKTFRAV